MSSPNLRPRSPRLLRRRLLAAMAGLAALLLIQRDANATCGDYLWMGSHGQNAPSAMTLSDLPHPEAPARPPCHGPECSRAPDAPFAPVPTPTTPNSHEWGVLAARLLPPAADRFGWSVCDSTLGPTVFGGSVFRPPR